MSGEPGPLGSDQQFLKSEPFARTARAASLLSAPPHLGTSVPETFVPHLHPDGHRLPRHICQISWPETAAVSWNELN